MKTPLSELSLADLDILEKRLQEVLDDMHPDSQYYAELKAALDRVKLRISHLTYIDNIDFNS